VQRRGACAGPARFSSILLGSSLVLLAMACSGIGNHGTSTPRDALPSDGGTRCPNWRRRRGVAGMAGEAGSGGLGGLADSGSAVGGVGSAGRVAWVENGGSRGAAGPFGQFQQSSRK